MLIVTAKGDYKKTIDSLKKLRNGRSIFSNLDKYGELGVAALSKATPVDTRETANSWEYRIVRNSSRPGIEWYNTSATDEGASIVILLQYGHGTGTGGYVAGRDFINPAMRPVFDKIKAEFLKEVSSWRR